MKMPHLLLTSGLLFSTMSHSEESERHVRKPLPPQEEIAELPEDGGEEFNRLVFEQSPYLLQHARNPVDWWPWSEEAFERARKEDKPIFLSIGYTTCHWCHVMEHESFEDEEVAKQINENFIPVKVDREERPDIDEVYMTVTQALTGSGGWPMTVLLTPDKDPFFAGTYFPKESKLGRPGIKMILTQLHDAWTNKRDEVVETSTSISEQLGNMLGGSPGGEISPDIFDKAFTQFSERYDPEHGGFNSAPKFPVPPNLMFLLRYHERTGNEQALEMVEKTLTEMRLGGVYDQVGFGIHRYSTTPEWLVPHFEKMLYDQALVAIANIETYQLTGKEKYADTAREILTYVLRDMTDKDGGFYSAEDADSEGEEGKFYVWTLAEIKEVLGDEDGQYFADTFQFTEEGNFLEEATQVRTGANIPHLKDVLSPADEKRIAPLREKLFQHRKGRIHPQKDDKILTDWNGLMIAAFAKAAQALQDEDYATAAKRAADFVLDQLMTEDGRLLKRYRNGEAGLTAHLEDYAFMIRGLLDLYETNFEIVYLQKALELQAVTDEFFWDEERNGYFMTADDAEELIVRSKKLYGGAIPGGNAVALENLTRLYRMTANPEFATRTEELIQAFSAEVEQQPSVYPMSLCGLDFYFGPSNEIVIAGEEGADDVEAMMSALQKPFLPRQVVLFRSEENTGDLAKIAAYTETQAPVGGKATAYVCRSFACKLPTNEVEKMMESVRE